MSKSIRFKLPPGVICGLVGGSNTGKSTYLQYIVENRSKILEQVPDHIIYVYEIWQKAYDLFKERNPQVIFSQSLDILEDYLGTGNILLCVDDKYSELNKRNSTVHRWLERLALMSCHHEGVDLFTVLHSPYYEMGTAINRSFTNLILFCNYRDSSYLSTLQREIFPGTRLLVNAYRHACKPYKPLILFLNPSFDYSYVSNSLIPSPSTQVYLWKDGQNIR